QDMVKKGTTTLGLVCKDGIVMAADKRASAAGRMVLDRNIEKVFPITDNIVMTIAGLVSDAQLITKIIKAELNLKKMRTGKEPLVKEVASLLGVVVYNNIRKFSTIPGIVGLIVGGADKDGFHLYNIGVDGSVMSYEDYTSDGSGMIFALGVLDTLYKKDLPVGEGVKLAIRALNAALQRDTATGDGIDVYTITKAGAKKVFAQKIDYTVNV
ncbi:MAG: proteasome subunit beta, partial [Candidatus Woesearchaeota archaeon]|nr:proteasome subunit beta [Candidatus Woesearchaeota archaeon]